MLSTLEEPTSGDIIVNGQNLWKMEKNGKEVTADEKHLRSVRGDIGMVFQHFNLFPHMTILENCTTAPIHVKGMNKAEDEQTAVEMIERVGLKDKKYHTPYNLSCGQKQQFALTT